jgi:asparaginyl-tRNA synthetase
MSITINNIKNFLINIEKTCDYETLYNIKGWVRTVRSSSNTMSFCNINDGSTLNGLQVVIQESNYPDIDKFNKTVKTGCYIEINGRFKKSPAKGQMFELIMYDFSIIGDVDDTYPFSKSRMKLDTLRNYIHLRSRTNVFGSIFRIRSALTKAIHDFYHEKGFLHLDPNIITINECEGGAGVFQLTEKDITNEGTITYKDGKYNWETDHFNRAPYLTVSSQLHLEALACGMGNVYTMNKSFRSEHSNSTKHVSEFTHLEIEMVNNTFDELMDISVEMIKYSIHYIFKHCDPDVCNLDKFISKGLMSRLYEIINMDFKKIKYSDVIDMINSDIEDKKCKVSKLAYGDDLGSEHENYITTKIGCGVFVTHWPMKLKSFYMKQCDDGTCESFDLLMPYGIGELIGASQREENYDKLINIMNDKNINSDDMEFYLDLRRYGTCPHGGFGLGFDRLLMMVTGIQNIKDVIPFPVYYKNCKY